MPAGRALRSITLPAAIVLLAAGVRLAWVASVDPDVGLLDDAGYYNFFARALADGRGYIREDGVPTAFWPVGYPAALALMYEAFGPSLTAAKLFNVVLGAAATALVYALARSWFTRATAAVAALLYALWPGAIAYTSVTMSETLFTVTFLASLLLLAGAPGRPEHAALGAIALGVVAASANYVRGQALLLPLLALPWLMHQSWRPAKAVAYAALAMATVLLLSLPWLVRNTDRFGGLTFLSTNTGINFWLGHRDGANGGPDYHAQLEFARRFDHLPRIEQEPAWSREGLSDGLDYAISHPLEEVRLSGLKIYQLYRSDADALLWNEQNGATPIFSDTMRYALRVVMDGYYYAVALLAIAGLYLGWRRREVWPVFFCLVFGYWTLVHIVFYGEPRLHVPLQPLLAVLAAAAIVELATRLAGLRPRLAPAK
jgi:4-amino-4-deoxy-L-arabinose transferase-like glycosyltransferase